MKKLTRYATWANAEGRKVTNVVLGDGPAPQEYVTADGTVLTLQAVGIVELHGVLEPSEKRWVTA